MDGDPLSPFSKSDIALMQDVDFLKQKKAIINHTVTWFEEIKKSIWLEESVLRLQTQFEKPIVGKVSKGENFKDLPYVVLDSPATFTREDIFAFRTMFWWGNYFSHCFLVSGRYQQLAAENLSALYSLGVQSKAYFDFSAAPWNHDLHDDNYQNAQSTSLETLQEHLAEKSFFKMSWRYNLTDWSLLKSRSLRNLVQVLTIVNP